MNARISPVASSSSPSGQDALAAAVAATSGLPADDLTARVLARHILQIPDLALPQPDPSAALDVIIGLLQRGWPACLSSLAGSRR